MLSILGKQIKETVKRQSPALLRLVGLKLLTEDQTIALLQPNQIYSAMQPTVHLAEVRDAGDPTKVMFPSKTVETNPDYVWSYPNSANQAEMLQSGSLRVGKLFLNTDFGNYGVIKELLTTDRREERDCPLLIAPWSHAWAAGYFDFTLFIVAKLGRLKAVMDPADFAQAMVAYPLLGTAYETEMLELLGIGPERMLDSRRYAPRFERCLLGNNSSWFYPSATDAMALRAIVEQQIPTPASWERKRLYISRVGRRHVLNEDALVQMLVRYGFEIIEDKPRSIVEQIHLYRSASFILGPHGASFANLLWCRPGTQLFELFPPQYCPEYFRYLTHMLGLRYAAYCLGPVVGNDHSYVETNVQVSVDEVERALVQLLKDELPSDV